LSIEKSGFLSNDKSIVNKVATNKRDLDFIMLQKRLKVVCLSDRHEKNWPFGDVPPFKDIHTHCNCASFTTTHIIDEAMSCMSHQAQAKEEI